MFEEHNAIMECLKSILVNHIEKIDHTKQLALKSMEIAGVYARTRECHLPKKRGIITCSLLINNQLLIWATYVILPSAYKTVMKARLPFCHRHVCRTPNYTLEREFLRPRWLTSSLGLQIGIWARLWSISRCWGWVLIKNNHVAMNWGPRYMPN